MSTKHGPKGKGKVIQGKAATKGKRVVKGAPAPEAVVEETAGEPIADDAADTEDDASASDATPASANVPAEAVIEATEPAPKRRRDKSIAELQAEYLEAVGRPTSSTNPAYIAWKCSQARKGRITVGLAEKRPARPSGSQQVLPLTLLRETTRLLDAAVAASGAKSRSAFIRAALIEKLRAIGGIEALAAADALASEAS